MENHQSHGRLKSVDRVTITLHREAAGYYNNAINVGFGLSPVRAGSNTFSSIQSYVSSHRYGSCWCSAGTGWKTFSDSFLCSLLYDFFTSDAQAIALYNGETGPRPFSANYAKFSGATMDVHLTYIP